MFDGVSKHGARHVVGVSLEECEERRAIALADFAEHPTAGFVDQVVRVVQESLAEGDGIFEVVVADEVQGSDDGHTSLPEDFGPSKLMEGSAWAGEEEGSEEGWGGRIDQVPVVDAARSGKIETVGLLGGERVFFAFDLSDEDEEGEHSFFVPGRLEERVDVREWKQCEVFGALAELRHTDAEEGISFAVVAGSGLEITHGVESVFWGRQHGQLLLCGLGGLRGGGDRCRLFHMLDKRGRIAKDW